MKSLVVKTMFVECLGLAEIGGVFYSCVETYGDFSKYVGYTISC